MTEICHNNAFNPPDGAESGAKLPSDLASFFTFRCKYGIGPLLFESTAPYEKAGVDHYMGVNKERHSRRKVRNLTL